MKFAVSVLTGALIGLGLAGNASAEQFLDFTVDESSIPGTPANTFTADKLNGGFTELVNFTSATTFSAQAYANIGQYFKNEGGDLVASYLNNVGTNGYGMYALFSATGTFSGLDFTGVTGAFNLYIDPLSDTTLGLTSGLVAPTVGNNADDYLVAFTTSLVAGVGTLASAPGAYNFDFKDFTLSSGDQNGSTAGDQNGENLFTAPRPFHILVQVNGDNDAASGTGAPGNPLRVTGDVSAVFKVPEPTSLALVGLALIGLGAIRRGKSVRS